MTPKKQLETPVLFLIFNRPDTTRVVFNEIRKARPKQLFVVSDGARNAGEKVLVEQTRGIINRVDWDCEVTTNFSEKNLGCKFRVSSGIDWFFENVTRGIILEDDCLPSQSFFWFCEELLERYADDGKVTMISGDNFQFGKNKVPYDYYFSKKYFHVWGWATWRRAWSNYDVNMTRWDDHMVHDVFATLFTNEKELQNRLAPLEKTRAGLINTWDYQWVYTCIMNGGLSIVPNVNLVTNIGFDARATHTTAENQMSRIPKKDLRFPLLHPKEKVFNPEADAFTYENDYRALSLFQRIKRKLKNLL